MKRLIPIIFAAFLAVSAHAQTAVAAHAQTATSAPAQTRDFIDSSFVSSTGQKLPYKMLLPENYDPAESYPLFLFLHGAGERGRDNRRHIYQVRKLLLNDANLKKAVVIAPQCPRFDKWADFLSPAFLNVFPESPSMPEPLLAVKELADSLMRSGLVDGDKIYGVGLSMGAFGLLDLTVRYPDMFAAAISICGGINTKRLEGYSGKTSFRFYHGKLDFIILPVFSRKAHETLEAQGVRSELIAYPWVFHESWNRAFRAPDFTEWLFSQ